jgi:hypothetical protein
MKSWQVKLCKKLKLSIANISVVDWFELLLLPAILVFGYLYYPLKDNGPSLSLWERVFGAKPYSAGLLRAISSVTHGEFIQAYEYNFLIYPVLLFLLISWINTLFRLVQVYLNQQTDPLV